jgi:XTP/dITP diphosphohydrolase
MKTILFATTNQSKVKECRHIMADLPIQLISLNEYHSKPLSQFHVSETGGTFTANAIIKAKAYGQYTGLITLCDDSGLIVDSLNGRPGVQSHRYGPTDLSRIQKLLHELSDIPDAKRTARFICAIAIYDPHNHRITTALGTTEGKITRQPLGTNGFGFDPVFYSTKLHQTFAQCTPEDKNRVSHRGQALQKAKKIIASI